MLVGLSLSVGNVVTVSNAALAEDSVGPSTGTVFHEYAVRARLPNVLVVADAPAAELNARATEQWRQNIQLVVDKLVAEGQAKTYSFDQPDESLRIELNDSGRRALAANPLVASITRQTTPARTAVPADTAWNTANSARGNSITTQSVSSVDYIQVYSPFMWGHVSVGGLSVQLTLEDSTGAIKGVACQTYRPAPNNYVQIDRVQLYFETVFVDPQSANGSSCLPAVNILPNDRVHVVTSGLDPTTGTDVVDDRTIVVDDVQTWTNYQTDTVSGTAPPGSSVTVTVGPLNLSTYLTPSTYRQVTADPATGNFSVSQFCAGTSTACNSAANLTPGSTGFVRVQHPNGDEVYTVQGQSLSALQNSSVLQGYAFPLPIAPIGLGLGVTVPRPLPSVSVVLKSAAGQVLDTEIPSCCGFTPYTITFSTPIVGGDVIEVTVNQGPTNELASSALMATVDLGADQVDGTGPPGTPLTLGVGRIDGYITASSAFTYVQQSVTTDASGHFSSGPIHCGTTNTLDLQPGSFGYVGYQDPHGNFFYSSFAAPRSDVAVNFPYVEGWVSDGTDTTVVTVLGPDGTIQSQVTAVPKLLYAPSQRLFFNVYYNATPSQFIVPGDTVTVSSGGTVSTIPVDSLTGIVTSDADFVSGTAPPESAVRVILVKDRSAFDQVTAGPSGRFTTGNPFTSINDSSCTQGTRTEIINPGDGGRIYLSHADGNQVFAGFGRSMHVNENENFLELFPYATDSIDMVPPPATGAITVTLTSPDGPTVTQSVGVGFGLNGDTKMSLLDAQGQKALIRAGDGLAISFSEGTGPVTRLATMTLNPIPLVTGSPDLDSNTLAGVGPPSWYGLASLNPPPGANVVGIPPRSSAAYLPFSFTTGNSASVPLALGYSGIVSFTDTAGHRVWSAWAVTALPVKISGFLRPGTTQICGVAPPSSPVSIYDVSDVTTGLNVVLGSGTSDAQGNFCVAVSPPLHLDQVVMAGSNGTLSQPVVVENPIFIPFVRS